MRSELKLRAGVSGGEREVVSEESKYIESKKNWLASFYCRKEEA